MKIWAVISILAGLAALGLLALALGHGVYVGTTDRIDRGALIRRTCHYLSWRGFHTIGADEDGTCPLLAEARRAK